MERTLSKELPAKVGTQVLTKGWLHNVRDLGKLMFVIIRDRTGLFQVLVNDQKEQDKLKGLQTGSILEVTGTVAKATTELGVEIQSPDISVVTAITEPSPIDITKTTLDVSLDTLLDHRSVVLRHPRQQAIFKVQEGIKQGFREVMQKREFTEISSPKFLAEASEGGTNVFKVPYFYGTTIYLAQSPQFYKQIMVSVFERVFEIGPVFRAEKHDTPRHMNEYVSLDAEMGFIDSWQDVLELMTYVIKYVINYVWDHYETELKRLGATKPLIDAEVPQLKISEIHELVFKETGEDFRGEPDLEPKEERFVCEYAAKNWNSDLVLATHFPTKKRPFYTYPSDEDPEETYSADMLFRGVEIITGGQRINNYKQLLANAHKWGVDEEKITDYLDAFKYGMPAEGGFGMGLERVTQKIIGLDNIKEASLFVTDLKRAGGVKIKRERILGGKALRTAIINLLNELGIKFKHIEHEETPTAEDAARVRGIGLERGVKAILLVGKKSGKNYMVNIPGDRMLDFNKAREIIGEKVEMEKPEVIMEKYGLQIGGIPPFGTLLGLNNYFDQEILTHPDIAFNCGLRTETIMMESKALIEAAEGILKVLTKN